MRKCKWNSFSKNNFTLIILLRPYYFLCAKYGSAAILLTVSFFDWAVLCKQVPRLPRHYSEICYSFISEKNLMISWPGIQGSLQIPQKVTARLELVPLSSISGGNHCYQCFGPHSLENYETRKGRLTKCPNSKAVFSTRKNLFCFIVRYQSIVCLCLRKSIN